MTVTFAFRGVLYRMTSPLHHEFAGVASGGWDAFNAFSGQSNSTNYPTQKEKRKASLEAGLSAWARHSASIRITVLTPAILDPMKTILGNLRVRNPART